MIREILVLLLIAVFVALPWLKARAEEMGVSNQQTQLQQFTVADLPACGGANTGALAMVTDALLPALLGIVVGGGATKTVVMCNGSNWIVS